MQRVAALARFLSLVLIIFVVAQTRACADKVVMRETKDPELLKATSVARSHLPEFVTAFNNKEGDRFDVKVPFKDAVTGRIELMWIRVKQINGSTVSGSLDSDPILIKSLKAGDPVSAKQADIEDWTFVDKANTQRGLFLAPILNKRASLNQK